MDINFNFMNLPNEALQKIFYDSGLTVKDMGICLKVSKLFNSVASYPGIWERWAKALYPQGNWTQATRNPSFKWKEWVINYKNSEQTILNSILNYANDIILRDSVAKTLYQQLTVFLHSDNAETQYRIGEALIKGWGTHRNRQEGVKYLQLAANQNCSKAHIGLGYYYLQSDPAKAFEYFELAAKMGLKEAYPCLAMCFEKGIGCQPDPVKTFQYMEQAANFGIQGAQYGLGNFYQHGKGCQPDQLKAFQYYELSAKKGCKEAQMSLAICYEKGIGCQPDLDKSIQYCELAANQDHREAQMILGKYYLNGRGCQQDSVKAFKYFELAANQGEKEAKIHIAICYEKGIGCQRDPVKAVKEFKYFEQEANMGAKEAQLYLAICYENGIGCQPDPDKALEYYEMAAAQGCDQGKEYLRAFPSYNNEIEGEPPAKKQRRD